MIKVYLDNGEIFSVSDSDYYYDWLCDGKILKLNTKEHCRYKPKYMFPTYHILEVIIE